MLKWILWIWNRLADTSLAVQLVNISGGLGVMAIALTCWNYFSTSPMLAQVAMLSAILAFASCLVMAGVVVSDKWKESQPSDATGIAQSELRLEYDPQTHFTRHDDGSVQVRFTISNAGLTQAEDVQVRIGSLVPQKNKKQAKPFSTQFNSRRLQVVSRQPGFSLHPGGDSAEVLLVHAQKNEEFFWIDALGDDEKPTIFKTPATEYEISVIATARNGGGVSRTFRAYVRRNGELGFDTV